MNRTVLTFTLFSFGPNFRDYYQLESCGRIRLHVYVRPKSVRNHLKTSPLYECQECRYCCFPGIGSGFPSGLPPKACCHARHRELEKKPSRDGGPSNDHADSAQSNHEGRFDHSDLSQGKQVAGTRYRSDYFNFTHSLPSGFVQGTEILRVLSEHFRAVIFDTVRDPKQSASADRFCRPRQE